jgi:hypothetical protein
MKAQHRQWGVLILFQGPSWEALEKGLPMPFMQLPGLPGRVPFQVLLRHELAQDRFKVLSLPAILQTQGDLDLPAAITGQALSDLLLGEKDLETRIATLFHDSDT